MKIAEYHNNEGFFMFVLSCSYAEFPYTENYADSVICLLSVAYAHFKNAECYMLNCILLSRVMMRVILNNVITLGALTLIIVVPSVVMPSVFTLNVVMLSVVAPSS
jgi:hypothetical protein